jgi:hypothetical protein
VTYLCINQRFLTLEERAKTMKRVALAILTLMLINPVAVEASKTVPYKNQKNGQFCKTVDVKKTVTLPDGTQLICKKEGTRARWKIK